MFGRTPHELNFDGVTANFPARLAFWQPTETPRHQPYSILGPAAGPAQSPAKGPELHVAVVRAPILHCFQGRATSD